MENIHNIGPSNVSGKDSISNNKIKKSTKKKSSADKSKENVVIVKIGTTDRTEEKLSVVRLNVSVDIGQS